jgi:hypothetical protein
MYHASVLALQRQVQYLMLNVMTAVCVLQLATGISSSGWQALLLTSQHMHRHGTAY